MKRVLRQTVLLTVMTLLLCGCLPIELSVSKDGKILIPRKEGFCSFDPASGKLSNLYAPESEKPAMGLFSPDDKSILAVNQASGGGMGSSFSVAIVPVDGGNTRKLGKFSNMTYARWSPDGKMVTITRVADNKKPPLEEQLPELVLIDAGAGTNKVLAGNVSKLIRWFPDSGSILTFQIMSKNKENGLYSGQLVKLDVAGKSIPLVSVLGDKNVFFDISPDGKSVLFTAIEAVKTGGTLPEKPGERSSKLFHLDVATGELKQTEHKVIYAIYSPKGTRVLLGSGSGDGVRLMASDSELKDQKIIAKDAIKSAGSGPSNADFYPAWLGEDKVIYLTYYAVYGTQGKNLHLISIGIDGKSRRDMQNAIDTGASN